MLLVFVDNVCGSRIGPLLEHRGEVLRFRPDQSLELFAVVEVW